MGDIRENLYDKYAYNIPNIDELAIFITDVLNAGILNKYSITQVTNILKNMYDRRMRYVKMKYDIFWNSSDSFSLRYSSGKPGWF